MVSDYTGRLALDAGFVDPIFEIRGDKIFLIIIKDGIESVQAEAKNEKEMQAELSRLLCDQMSGPLLEEWEEYEKKLR